MKKSLTALLFVGFAVGCNGDTPTDVPAPDFAVAGNSGCYTVKGTFSETGFFPDFSGAMDGDLVGTSATTLGLDFWQTGTVIHNPGERTIEVTGGIAPELVGRTIHLKFQGLSVFNAPPLVTINSRERVDEGAAKFNLTVHGTLDQTVFPWELAFDYNGIVCP
jgi:hypothetical protein